MIGAEELTLFLVASFGMSNAITRESVFRPVREFVARKWEGSMLDSGINCETCMGFHSGWVIALCFPSLGIHPILGAFAASAVCKALSLFLYR